MPVTQLRVKPDRYLRYKRTIITLRWKYHSTPRGAFYAYTDALGGVYAFSDDAATTLDPVTRCGIGIFSLPADHPLTAVCAPHDFKYDSPVWQAYNSRAEADEDLKKGATLLGYPVVGRVFKFLSQAFGWLAY